MLTWLNCSFGTQTTLESEQFSVLWKFPTFVQWMYIMDAQVGLKTIALTLFLNLFFHFLPAAALCDDCSLVDSVETLNADSYSLWKQVNWFVNGVHLCTPAFVHVHICHQSFAHIWYLVRCSLSFKTCFAIFLSVMTAHDSNQNDDFSTLSSSSSRQQFYNESLFSMLNVQKLVVKFAIVKQLHKEWKAICVKGCCEYPPPQSQVLGLAAARSDESTLGIFADSTNSNITTNSTFFGSFALDFVAQVVGPLYLDFGKKGLFLAIYWYCLWILFLHFPCTFYERLRELFVGGKIFSWVSVWFTIVLLVRLISCLMTKKIASHNSLTFHHLISGLVSLHNF